MWDLHIVINVNLPSLSHATLVALVVRTELLPDQKYCQVRHALILVDMKFEILVKLHVTPVMEEDLAHDQELIVLDVIRPHENV